MGELANVRLGYLICSRSINDMGNDPKKVGLTISRQQFLGFDRLMILGMILK
jgi:hypothetical protein